MNYYNDNDKNACAWLRELIAEGLLPKGDVDERSIDDVRPEELSKYDQCHFFSGVGGWPLALAWAGLGTERGIWTGSCPCQPFSCAGKGLGTADERHLWPAFFGLIRTARPSVVFGEQVASADVVGKAGGRAHVGPDPVWLDGVRGDLERAGYAFGAAVLGAFSVGAPHRRKRLYWVADAAGGQREQLGRPQGLRLQRPSECGHDGVGNAESDNERRLRERRTVKPLETGGPGHDGVADVLGERLERHAGHGGDRAQPGRYGAQTAGHAASSCATGVVGDSEGCGRKRESVRPEGEQAQRDQDATAAWSRFVILPCRDGKLRRVPAEPSLFPLADGIPGRVGLLRGAGNAVIPQVAEAFVRAWLKTKER